MIHHLLLIGLVVAVVAVVLVASGSSRRSGRAVVPQVALIASLAAILAVTLAPIGDSEHETRLVPMKDLVEALTPPVDERQLIEHALNVLLFVPLGAALALRGLRLGRAVLAVVALSFAVEVAQWLVISGRTTSVSDVVLNALGALLGHRLVAARGAGSSSASAR